MAGYLSDAIIVKTSGSFEKSSEDVKSPEKAMNLSKELAQELIEAAKQISNVTHGHLYVKFDDKDGLKDAIFSDLRGYREGKLNLDLKPGTFFIDKIGSIEITETNVRELAKVFKEAASVGSKLSKEYISTRTPQAPTPEHDVLEDGKITLKELKTEAIQEIKETKQEIKEWSAGADEIRTELGVNESSILSNSQNAQVELAMRSHIRQGLRNINSKNR